jgi:hypothetical protein
MKIYGLKNHLIILAASATLGGCSASTFSGKATIRTGVSSSSAPLPQQYGGDATADNDPANGTVNQPPSTLNNNPPPVVVGNNNPVPVNNNPPAPPCDGVEINGTCHQVKAIHRCRSNFDTGFYTNHIYVTEASECNLAGYVFEATPYFYALPAMDKTLIRWHRTGLSGKIQHYYLQPGETTPPSYPLVYNGPTFTISGSDFNQARKVSLYRCVVNCGVLGNHPRCDANMQWISLDPRCEGNGVGPGAILGFAIAP